MVPHQLAAANQQTRVERCLALCNQRNNERILNHIVVVVLVMKMDSIRQSKTYIAMAKPRRTGEHVLQAKVDLKEDTDNCLVDHR